MKYRSQRGYSLIEFIIASAILAIVMTALVQVVITAYRTLGESKLRVTAKSLANEKIELARNLPYANVGTVGGIPSGVLAQQETQTLNGNTFTIKTSVVYIDDPFDGVAPTDTLPTDYKRVRVEVIWNGIFASTIPVVQITDIAPNGVETNSGGGTLQILVFNSLGQPVPQAQVHITNTVVTPNIDLTLATDTSGYVLLPGSPACSSCYNISVTKNGYSTDRTYTTSEVASPNKPSVTILVGKLTPISFAIDQVATVTFLSKSDRGLGFSPLGNVPFHIQSTKTIGDDSLGNPVYKVDNDYTTDSSGQYNLPNVEWDSYTITKTASGYDLAGINPLQPMAVVPTANISVLLALSSHSTNSLLLSVIDASGSAIASSSATLSNASTYNKTIQTGLSSDPDFGQAFFNSLTSGSYTIIASASGFQTATTPVTISGQTTQKVTLSP